MTGVTALSAAGRLSVTMPAVPRRSNRTSGCSLGIAMVPTTSPCRSLDRRLSISDYFIPDSKAGSQRGLFMNELARNFQPGNVSVDSARVDVLTGAEVAGCPRWPRAFAHARKDHRYYEIVEKTIRQGFDYGY